MAFFEGKRGARSRVFTSIDIPSGIGKRSDDDSSEKTNPNEDDDDDSDFNLEDLGLDLGDLGTTCDKAGATKEGNVGGMNVTLVCEEGYWIADEEAMEEMFSCTAEEEGSKKQMEVGGTTVDMICEDGEWTADYSCTAEEEGQTKTMEVMGLSMDLVCHDGEWVSDNSCSEEGATKEMMGMPMVGEGGEWTLNMSF
jgi:hypothetical protein